MSDSPRRAGEVLDLPAGVARRFLVRRHLLGPPRSLPGEPESVLRVVERLGSLQFDPLETPGARSHDLVLHARIRGYRRAHCDDLLYAASGERKLFEAYNKCLNILPASDLPYHRHTWLKARERYREGILASSSAAVRSILGKLRAEGPLFTSALSEGLGGPVDWHWAPTAEGRAVLEALFESGRVGIHRREGNRKSYDLIERLFPEELLKRRVRPADMLRHRLLSRYRAMGLLGAKVAGITRGAGTAEERARHLAALVDDGTLVKARVEGVRGERFLLGEELSIVEESREGALPPAVTLVAPLDPLIWDRRLLHDLFGLHYRWEVYTPEAKRSFGYYVLPILFGERMVGRIEPRFDRAAGELRVMGAWLEPGFDPEEPGFFRALGEALEALRLFAGAGRVRWPRRRTEAALARGISGAAPLGP